MLKNTNSNNIIQLHDVAKTYESSNTPALKSVSFDVEKEEFLCLIGPSGCGKSTILKIIAGLDAATTGTVATPPNISMVFQNGALLPWLTVYENVALGLRSKKIPDAEVARLVKKHLEMVSLQDFASKYPRELSGGQRQRVGIARALAVEPSVLLLDEPFSALDPKTTDELHQDILRIWHETRVTIVMVSHLIEEAVSLADRVILIKDGTVSEIFTIPLPYPRREHTETFAEIVRRVRSKFFA